ncbi:MAG: ABC transporter substrate-binding protein [Pseudomonadota bacterium]
MTLSRRAFVAAPVAGLLLPASITRARSAEDGPRRGGRLNFVIHPEPTTLVCFNTTEGPAIQASSKVVEGLLTYDFDLNPRPQLATAWSVSEDGLQYRFELRRNVSWHDGQPFTAADVVYSFGLLKSAHPRGRTTFANLHEVRALDDHTVQVVLTKPAPYLLTALAAGESPIVPRHLYDGKGDPLLNPNNRAPIGTGPFVFKEWVNGSYISYVRNPNYWDAPKPYLDALLVRIIPDGAARAVAFETGEIDIGGSTPVSPLDLERLQKLPHLALENRGSEYAPTLYGIEFNLDNPYLRHKLVRQAIAHAIDPSAVLNVAWYGLGDPTVSIVSPTLKRFYNPNVKTYAFDPKKAAQLLDQAGFPLNGRFRFALTHDYQPFGENFKRTGEYLKSALAAVGIDVTVRGQDFPSYLKRVYADRDYDFTNHPFTNMFDPTVGLQRFFTSDNFRKGVAFTNASHYANPEVDRLFAEIAVEADATKRKAAIDRFQDILADELPVIPLMLSRSVTVANRKVVDHTVDATGVQGNFAGVWLRS